MLLNFAIHPTMYCRRLSLKPRGMHAIVEHRRSYPAFIWPVFGLAFIYSVCLPWLWVRNFQSDLPDADYLAYYAYRPALLMSILGAVALVAAVFRHRFAILLLILAGVWPTAYVYLTRSVGRGGVVIGATLLISCAALVWYFDRKDSA
jgi:hypothetical protein